MNPAYDASNLICTAYMLTYRSYLAISERRYWPGSARAAIGTYSSV